MTRAEAINAIKNNTKLLGLLFTDNKSEVVDETKEEVKLQAVKLKDSDQMVDVQGELAPDTKVVTSSSMGSVDAPDGQYDLENGQSFTTKGGKVDKVLNTGLDDDSEDSSDEDMAKAAPELPSNMAALAALSDKITEMDSMLTAVKSALEGKASKSDMSAMTKSLNEIGEAFNVLADTPAEFTKIDRSLEAKEEKYKKIEALASIISKKK
jgi:hypothetical protein